MALSLSALQRRKASGFTLIEVMIVVAIIAILAGVAYPSYTDYVRRGRIQEAFSQLSLYRAKMEQYYQDNRNYGTATGCASDTSASSWNTFSPTPPSNVFTYACRSDSPYQTYTITATGQGAVLGNDYTIDNEGLRKTTKFKGSTSTESCWLSSGSACP